MPTPFSKTPIGAPAPTFSGLMCAHPYCFTLFSNLDDSEAHGNEAHAGKMVTVSCAVSEHQLANGEIKLLRVLDKDGERLENLT